MIIVKKIIVKIFLIIMPLIVFLDAYSEAAGLDSSIGQMLRGFNGNFYADVIRAGGASSAPNILLNPALSYQSKFISSIEFYSQDRYSKVNEPVKYRNINFIIKERELLKIPDIQFGIHYSSFALDNIAEYENVSGNPVFRGYAADEETLLLFNFNTPFYFKNKLLRAGANIKFYKHSLADISADAAATDFGLLWITENLNTSIAVKNFFSTELKYKNAKYNLPLQYLIAASYKFNILPALSLFTNCDYTVNTQNTDNNLAMGLDLNYNPQDKKYSLNFIYGTDNIYTAHSIAVKLEYNRSFNCGFGYSLNRNRELGDNTLIFAGWNFGALEEKKYEKYLELEATGEKNYRNGEWREALMNWENAANLYPSKKTSARISYDLLNAQLKNIETLNADLYKSNINYFNNGILNFQQNKHYDALINFSAVKFGEDFKNKKIYSDAAEYIKQIIAILQQAASPDSSVIFSDTPQEKVKDIYLIISTLIDINKPEMAEEYLNKYSSDFSDTERHILIKYINEQKLKLSDYIAARNKYKQLTESLKIFFKNNDFKKVIEIYNLLISEYKNFDFQNIGDFEIYYNIARNADAQTAARVKITPAELQLIDDYYKSAAKHYLNYLKNSDKSELLKSIIFYERILKIDPEHKSKTEYLKAKTLYDS